MRGGAHRWMARSFGRADLVCWQGCRSQLFAIAAGMGVWMGTEAASDTGARRLGFTFTGTAGAYFGIWIVNLLLSIVTLGIYTAWAKVRRMRYFYGNTWLDAHNFEYHARPSQILIGRLIVVAALIVYNVLINVSPVFLVLIVPYLGAFPWLINKSFAFNARMTSYRNVRFVFGGTYWGAFRSFILWPLAASLTAGVLLPFASRSAQNYIGNNLRFGTAAFKTKAPLRSLYGLWGVCMVLVLALLLFAAGSIFTLVSQIEGDLDPEHSPFAIAAILPILVAYIGMLLLYIFYRAGVRNIAYNATTLDGRHQLESRVGRIRYVWILVSNLFAALFTLGLMIPWGAIRTWRYLAAKTALIAVGPLDEFVDQAAPEGNVAAAEYFDVEGIDFGL